MTVHLLLADPPLAGLALPELTGETTGGEALLEPAAATRLAGGMIKDVVAAVARCGGELVVCVPPDEQQSETNATAADPAVPFQSLVGNLADSDDVRYRPLAGASVDARVSDAITASFDAEDADSVAVLDGRVPTLDHTDFDSAAMKLRRSEAVLGPAPGGGVNYLGLTDAIDLEGIGHAPSLQRVVNRAIDAGLDVDFLPMHPRVDGVAGLTSLVALVEARRMAGRRIPTHTADAIDELGLAVVDGDGSRQVVTQTTDRA